MALPVIIRKHFESMVVLILVGLLVGALVCSSGCLEQGSNSSTTISGFGESTSVGGMLSLRIENFTWSPTKVVWDKVYDAKVSFVVESEFSQISHVEVRWIPVEYEYFITKYGMRPEDYPKVFPPDKERVYVLKPLDGKFDEQKEEFSVEIKNITGGREYKILIIAKDQENNTKTFEYKTPYIRQYENFGRQLYEKGIIVGASYYTWFRNGENNWKDGHKYIPLLGEYSSSDRIVINKHIDWATGYGINTFLVSWNGPNTVNTYVFENEFLSTGLSNNILVALMYESGSRLKNSGSSTLEIYEFNDPENTQKFSSDFVYINVKYFSLPNYLKINKKPFIYFYASNAYRGNFDKTISDVKKIYKIFACGSDITPYISPKEVDEIEKRISVFDAERSWVGLWVQNDLEYPKNYEKILKNKYSEWNDFLSLYGRIFIPTLIPSFDSSYVTWGSKNQYPLEKNPERFETRIKIIFPYIKKNKILIIDTWNDWFEASNIEPSHEFGFVEIEKLKFYLESIIS